MSNYEKIEELKNMPGGHRFVINEFDFVQFKMVKAYEARNYDGSPSGWEQGTADGDRLCMEVLTHIDGINDSYKNYWNMDTAELKYSDYIKLTKRK